MKTILDSLGFIGLGISALGLLIGVYGAPILLCAGATTFMLSFTMLAVSSTN